MLNLNNLNLTALVIMASLALLAALAAAPTLAASSACDGYKVSGLSGAFTTLVQADFSSATAGGNAESYLDQFGLQISDYPVDEKNAISHYFSPDNVALGAGSVDLTVRAYDGGEYVYGAEIVTADTTLYGSLRTVLKSSTTGGVCEGMFFYLDDSQETDWEILTSTTLTPSVIPAGI